MVAYFTPNAVSSRFRLRMRLEQISRKFYFTETANLPEISEYIILYHLFVYFTAGKDCAPALALLQRRQRSRTVAVMAVTPEQIDQWLAGPFKAFPAGLKETRTECA